ncbi:C40 family peptidase [Leptotrichia sp. HSP-334]|uniref:C40 family peptidase n=1 Tax=Leptotrichia rugosa TaxID=3239302 RepID=A0AB39VJ03_9FUSO
MKKIIFVFFITTVLSFTNGLRFMMEKDKIDNLNLKNSQSEKEISEIGDVGIKSLETNLNTDIKLINNQKNKKTLLNNLLNKIVKESNTYLGTPYLWGGTTRNGIDCSAFVKNVYLSIGIKLPRVSQNQAKVGKTITLDKIRKGDLIFFETDKNRPNTVSHVGIYLGSGNLIHASSKNKKVVIVPLNQGYFLSKIVIIKRIVDVI